MDFARSISPYERYGQSRPATDAHLREHILKAGETISGLAHRYYGDWRLWRILADRNQIVDVRRLEPGDKLLIPELPPQRGLYESL